MKVVGGLNAQVVNAGLEQASGADELMSSVSAARAIC